MSIIFNEQDFNIRLRESISFAWEIFKKKVGNGTIVVNKEASMQLHYAYILQSIVPLIQYKKDQTATVELETGVKLGESTREIDLLLTGKSNDGEYIIAVEMKCYKKYAASGKLRGATDIFMKDVYQDLEQLEGYCSNGHAACGVSLVMNNLERLVNPKNKTAKCWDYDISNGARVNDAHLTTPIGGKNIDITLTKSYEFLWNECGDYWFMELEGK